MVFQDRNAAGRTLGTRLEEFANDKPLLVLALPRGGIPVAFEVARALHAPLDVFLVRKLGAPGQEELAIGAIASGGVRMLDTETIRALRIPPSQVEAITQREARELEGRELVYRGNRGALDVRGQTVIVVDDGMATGSTMRVAVRALRQQDPRKIVAAVPVGSPEICREIAGEADAVVCLYAPAEFFAVGQWYRDFSQVSDAEVRDLLNKADDLHGKLPAI